MQNINSEINILRNENKYIIPTITNYDIVRTGKYRIIELKKIAKRYNLKVSGKKQELINRIYNFLSKFNKVVLIQSLFRGYIIRKYFRLHGQHLYLCDRKKCVNDTDFLTLDYIDKIPYSQFITDVDNNGFIYGFDICSLYNFFKSQKEPFNPYTREPFKTSFLHDVKEIIKLSYIVNIPINIKIDDDFLEKDNPSTSIFLRTEKIFQMMDELGNYTNSDWLSSLNRIKLIEFIRQLKDIVDYRIQLSPQVRCEIYPPHGNFFFNINIPNLIYKNDLFIRSIAITVIERMVLNGVDNNSKSLGATYVLMALSLVNSDAANALPWLYQSVV